MAVSQLSLVLVGCSSWLCCIICVLFFVTIMLAVCHSAMHVLFSVIQRGCRGNGILLSASHSLSCLFPLTQKRTFNKCLCVHMLPKAIENVPVSFTCLDVCWRPLRGVKSIQLKGEKQASPESDSGVYFVLYTLITFTLKINCHPGAFLALYCKVREMWLPFSAGFACTSAEGYEIMKQLKLLWPPGCSHAHFVNC